MEELLPRLLAFPPHPPPRYPLSDKEYDTQISTLAQLLSQTIPSRLLGAVSGGVDLLDVLDPSINTLPYLHALLAKISTQSSDKTRFSPTNELWQKVRDFLTRFDPVQIRYAGPEWRHLLNAVVIAAETASDPNIAIEPIRLAMLRLDPSTACFTSTHLIFADLCLRAKAFSAALPILENNIYYFPSISGKWSHLPLPCSQHDISSTYITTATGLSDKLKYQDHLTYFLYGAMIYMGLRNWDRASLFLEIVVTSPTGHTASMIQVEAYKKWVLVSLLLTGRPKELPRNINPSALKIYHALAKPYDVLVAAFKDDSIGRLHAEFNAGHQIWQRDSNYGLALQIISAHRRFAVINVSKTFAAISIPALAQRTSQIPDDVAETENYVASLIADGQLNATLTASPDPNKPSIVRFADFNQKGSLVRTEKQRHNELLRHKHRMDILTKHMEGVDRKMELTKEYVEWTRKTRKAKETGDSGLGDYHGSDVPGAYSYGADDDMLADL